MYTKSKIKKKSYYYNGKGKIVHQDNDDHPDRYKIKETKYFERKNYFATLIDGFKNTLEILFSKHEQDIFLKNKNVGVITCYDGANHKLNDFTEAIVVSCSNSIFNRDIIDKKSKITDSLRNLT